MAKYQRILVTGAGGFIGSHLTEALVRRGYDVRAMVEYNSNSSWGWLDTVGDDIKSSVEVVLSDIRDPHAMRLAVKGCDLVLHLAALIAIPYSYAAPQSYVDTNITGTLNLLQAARDLGVSRFVHTSTSEVYGTARFVPITEEHPLQGQSPYAASKIGADQMALSFHRSFELPVSVIRPFNTYGPRQSARAVIPTIITQVLSGKTQLHLGSLHPTRDFNYVADVAAGFIAVAEAAGSVGEVINVGSNFEISIGDTVRVIAEVLGRDVTIQQDDQRLRPALSEVERLWADNAKAASLAHWRPAYGGLEGFRRGIAETAAWFAEPANLGLYKADVFNR